MPDPLNVLVLIHGMTPEKDPRPAGIRAGTYAPLRRGIARGLSRFLPSAGFDDASVVEVFYGLPHGRTPGLQGPGEEALADAENGSAALSPDAFSLSAPLWSLLVAVMGLKNHIVRRGLGDCVYYCSEQGEWDIRWSVYSQILDRVLPLLEQGRAQGREVKLHFVAHSLGVAVAHDLAYLLYGTTVPRESPPGSRTLFSADTPLSGGKPLAGFFLNAHAQALADGQAERLRSYARALGDPGARARLRFGSFHGLEGQLPLFALRKTANLGSLAQDPPAAPYQADRIGVDLSQRRLQLQFFYAPPDILGFGSVGLYQGDPRSGKAWARERALNYYFSVFNPLDYHTRCLTDGSVHRDIAEVIAANW